MPKTAKKKKTTLVLCIDRDDDLGVKVGLSGPVIGREKNLLAANKLALKDPTDSDVNSIFKAVQVLDKIKSKGPAEIVTITGDSDVGITSDRKIASDLEKILLKYDVTEAVLVTDGAEDEYVLPIIKSKINVVYPEKIIVRQSQQLESMYYVAYDFIMSVLADPKASRLFIGLPAIALIIYAFLGAAGFQLIVGVVGTYLFVKGFQLESFLEGAYIEASTAFKTRKSSFFMYFSAVVPLIVGLANGYKAVSGTSSMPLYISASAFLNESIILFFFVAVLVGLGKTLGMKKRPLSRYLTYFSLSFSIAWLTYEITRFLLRETASYIYIMYALVASGALIFISSVFEKKTKKK